MNLNSAIFILYDSFCWLILVRVSLINTQNVSKIYIYHLYNDIFIYLSLDMRGEDVKYWSLYPSLRMMVDRKEFAANEKLPCTRWFE